jgi:DNA-binding response OmpR family regulator
MSNQLQTEALVTVTPLTILVIDDDPDIRCDLTMLLEDQGYRVITAGDGQAGLNRAQADRPDLVIVDMMMPKMSGFIVLERLKQHQKQQLPVIMLTANESDHQRAFAEFLGVDAYLNKPIGTKALLDRVHGLCPIKSSQPTSVATDTVA